MLVISHFGYWPKSFTTRRSFGCGCIVLAAAEFVVHAFEMTDKVDDVETPRSAKTASTFKGAICVISICMDGFNERRPYGIEPGTAAQDQGKQDDLEDPSDAATGWTASSNAESRTDHLERRTTYIFEGEAVAAGPGVAADRAARGVHTALSCSSCCRSVRPKHLRRRLHQSRLLRGMASTTATTLTGRQWIDPELHVLASRCRSSRRG